MRKQRKFNTLAVSIAAGSSLLLAACGGGSSGATTGGGQNLTGAPISAKSSPSLFSSSSCLSGSVTLTGTAWWVNATVDIKNACNSDQSLAGTTISFTAQDANGKPIQVGTLNNWWFNDTSYQLAFMAGNGNQQIANITAADVGKLAVPANQTLTFQGGFQLFGSEFESDIAKATFTINGASPAPTPTPTPSPSPSPTPAPVTTGSLNVIVDTTDTDCKGTTNCDGLNINITDSAGKIIKNFQVPTTSLGGKYNQPIQDLNAASYTVSGSTIPNTTVTYTPSATTSITAGNTSDVTITYARPVVTTGKATVNLASVVPNYTGNLQVQILNTKASNAVVNSYTIKQGASFTTEDLPVTDSTHAYVVKMTTGIADPLQGLYYVESGLPVLKITKGQTTSLAVPMKASTIAKKNVTVAISGMSTGDTAGVTFSDAANKYSYVNYANLANSSPVYKIESGLNLGTSVAAGGSSYVTNPITNTGVVSAAKTITAKFVQSITPTPTPTPPASIGGTYDFATKSTNASGIDYGGTFKIFFNPTSSTQASTVSFTSNVPDLDKRIADYGNLTSWDTTMIWSKTVDNATSRTKYTITFVKTGSSTPATVSLGSNSTLNFTWSPDQQGVPFEVVVPIISDVTVNGQSYVIPDTGKNTQDPGNGKVITGYQEQWSVYPAHNYMPEQIPFNDLNTINYAFVDFATPKSYPNLGVGNSPAYKVLSADGGADYRQMVELWKAKKRNPYLKVVLSFGGWTNDNETTYPDINFEQMTDAQQQAFAKQAVMLVKSMGFDGVDIDWEWWANHRATYQNACDATVKPGAPYCQGKVVNHSTQKYINLLKYLRAELGNNMILSIATVAAKSKVLSDEDTSVGGVVGAWKTIAGYVDHINVMAYDMHGAFDSVTDSQSPWDIDPANNPFYKTIGDDFTIKAALQAYISSGVPTSKLVLGMPAYGRSSKFTNGVGNKGGLYQPSEGAGHPLRGEYDDTGVFSYKCLLQNNCHFINSSLPSFTFYQQGSDMFNKYGSYNLTPWGVSSDRFIAFDDQNSVKAKFKAACATFGSLGGGMIWALDGDTSDGTSITKAVENSIHCQ